ncbi:class I SAM-dependent methyltransferase [Flammeovirga sp. MY04]|uniref:class I SAM-dependent methyltransferase n=1 Tax=Flammeovirga sp. MY04 TaxID=1191459 RepID=UPI0008061BD9|nr:class I SAM-dependent methyltransferase [Flammeovirga sp. MY04]ANQ49884.1 class I SAM-dependent methyltransferase [Flammeovirga sp. MY04]
MNITKIINQTQQPKLYEQGTSFMWTDPYISKQLLQVHLNPDIDLASRKKSTIEMTVDWILSAQKEDQPLKILDLGCGPGLYTELLAKRGHDVTGVDISENSIAHAKASAKEKGLNITYRNESYLEADLGENEYDLVILIYTDLGALIPSDRTPLLSKINQAVKPGGTFIFDVLKDRSFQKKLTGKSWEASKEGFWKGSPYLALSESFLYEKEKVILSQHTIIDEDENIDIYRFWTHFFSQNDVSNMLSSLSFSSITFNDHLLPESDMWNGDNVLFVRCDK